MSNIEDNAIYAISKKESHMNVQTAAWSRFLSVNLDLLLLRFKRVGGAALQFEDHNMMEQGSS